MESNIKYIATGFLIIFFIVFIRINIVEKQESNKYLETYEKYVDDFMLIKTLNTKRKLAQTYSYIILNSQMRKEWEKYFEKLSIEYTQLTIKDSILNKKLDSLKNKGLDSNSIIIKKLEIEIEKTKIDLE